MEQFVNGMTLDLPAGTFPLSTDSMVLADFVRLPKGASVLDLGSGAGTLGVLLCGEYPGCTVTGLELEEQAHHAAVENIRRNGLEHRLSSICADLRTVNRLFPSGSFHCCVSNPPYFDKSRGKTSKNDTVAASRAEENSDIFDVVKAAKCVLKWGGRLYFCYKPERIESAMKALFQNNFAVKRMQFVHQKRNKPANLVMIEARFGGGEWMDIEPPIIIEE